MGPGWGIKGTERIITCLASFSGPRVEFDNDDLMTNSNLLGQGFCAFDSLMLPPIDHFDILSCQEFVSQKQNQFTSQPLMFGVFEHSDAVLLICNPRPTF